MNETSKQLKKILIDYHKRRGLFGVKYNFKNKIWIIFDSNLPEEIMSKINNLNLVVVSIDQIETNDGIEVILKRRDTK